MSDICPRCGSSNVAVGNFVLSCGDCDWSFLNKHPCEVCQQPSFSVMGSGDDVHYRCREHGLSEDESRDILRRFFQKVRSNG